MYIYISFDCSPSVNFKDLEPFGGNSRQLRPLWGKASTVRTSTLKVDTKRATIMTSDDGGDFQLHVVIPQVPRFVEKAPAWATVSWYPDRDVFRVCEELKKHGRVWDPMKARYEDTNERIWCHILRNTPDKSRVCVIAFDYRTIRNHQETKSRHDMQSRRVEWLSAHPTTGFRGWNIDNYDYVLLTDSPADRSREWTKNVLLPNMQQVFQCHLFYCHDFGSLYGNAFIEISDPEHPYWDYAKRPHVGPRYVSDEMTARIDEYNAAHRTTRGSYLGGSVRIFDTVPFEHGSLRIYPSPPVHPFETPE